MRSHLAAVQVPAFQPKGKAIVTDEAVKKDEAAKQEEPGGDRKERRSAFGTEGAVLDML